jgi:hypothetical protein
MGLLDLFRAPVPHAADLRGLTLKEAERLLRDRHGYSRSGATRFVAINKNRLGLLKHRANDGRASVE